MKVTAIDHHSDTMCEQTLPIDIVADGSLANGGGKQVYVVDRDQVDIMRLSEDW